MLREKRYGQDKAAKYNKTSRKTAENYALSPLKHGSTGSLNGKQKFFIGLQAFSPPKEAERKRPAETDNNRADKKRVKEHNLSHALNVKLHCCSQIRKKYRYQHIKLIVKKAIRLKGKTADKTKPDTG